MPFIQKTSPPPNKVEFFNVTDFYGGLNNRDSYIELESTQSSDLMNIDFFSEKGVVQKRKGTQLYDEIVLDDGEEVEPSPVAVTFLDVYKPINSPHVVVRASNSEVWVDEEKVADVLGKVEGTTFNGKYYFVDSDKIRIYGTFPQSEDTYTKIIGTAVEDNIVMELVMPPSDFTPLDSTHKVGITRYNYTELKCWYEPCENEIGDDYKGANVFLATANNIAFHKDRMYITSPDDKHTIYISDIFNPMYFPNLLSIQLPPNGDEIVGLKVFHDSMIVGRKEDIHVIYGNTNRTDVMMDLFLLKKINTHTGLMNKGNVHQVHNHLFFLGSDGEYYGMHTTQTNEQILATQVINKTVDIKAKPLECADVDIQNSTGIFYNGLYFSSIGGIILVYSYLYRSWSVFDGINATSFIKFQNKLLIGDTQGRVVEFGHGYNDCGNAIVAYWASKRHALQTSSVVKKFKQMYVVAEAWEEFLSEVSLKVEVDYEEVDVGYTIRSLIPRWGVAVWGDIFAKWNIQKSLPIIINKRGRLIRFVFANAEVDQNFKIYEINGEYEVRGFR